MDFKILTNEIEAMKAYWYSLRDLQMKIEEIEYQEQNVKGIRYDKEPGSHDPNAEQYRLELVEKKNELEQMIDRTMLKYLPIKKSVIDALEKMKIPDRIIVCEKYGLTYEKMEKGVIIIFRKGKTYDQLNRKYHHANLWRYIKAEVEKL